MKKPEYFRFYNVVPCNIGREKLQAQDVIELPAYISLKRAQFAAKKSSRVPAGADAVSR